VVLTEWNEFRALDLKRLRQLMLGNVLVDLRNMYPEALAEEAGFSITASVGRCRHPLAGRRIGVASSRPRAEISAKSAIKA
jgi:hypothetical protein